MLSSVALSPIVVSPCRNVSVRTCKSVPTSRFSPIPTPPATVNAPLVGAVVPSVFSMRETPATSSVPSMSVFPLATSTSQLTYKMV